MPVTKFPSERIITGNGKFFGDGTRIIYVNCSAQGETALGRLAHDMLCRTPSDMRSEEWGRWTEALKFGERKGTMSEVVDRYVKEHEAEFREEARAWALAEGRAEGVAKGLHEGLLEAARRLLAAGNMTAETVARILGLDEAEVRSLAAAQ